MDKLISTKKVAEYLDVKPITVRRLANSGQIPSVRIGNRLRFDKKEIDKWLLSKSNRKPVHILVVDDEPVIGKLFKESLNETGYQVTTILSSLEALEIIKRKHFDLIFLDLVMPELDGAELFKHIREINKDVPVAIVTGYPHSKVMERAMEYGPFTVIKKPFVINDVLNAVRSVTGGGN